MFQLLLQNLRAGFVPFMHPTGQKAAPTWPPTQTVAAEPAEPAEPEWRNMGCGWFDSSHELAAGLRVQELATAQALAEALPLNAWLELELVACVGPT
jgi:hypothetical protein